MLSYSDYCTYSAQRRYFDRQPMRQLTPDSKDRGMAGKRMFDETPECP
jgi:hypothetical protein